MTSVSGKSFGPSHGLAGYELCLWRCYEATGEDVSGGPHTGWPADALRAVMEMREERDRFADLLEDTQVLMDKHAHKIREET